MPPKTFPTYRCIQVHTCLFKTIYKASKYDFLCNGSTSRLKLAIDELHVANNTSSRYDQQPVQITHQVDMTSNQFKLPATFPFNFFLVTR